MRTIDLNADLGELDDGLLDAAVMPFISSCNIACGGHAGDPESMRRTIRLAKEYGVAIGAHPSYPDRANFGRLSMELPAEQLCALVGDQIRLLKSIAKEEGVELRHVKLHGALYNDLTDDYEHSLAVAQTIAAINPEFRFIAFSGSETARAAEDAGLVAIHEVFADRTYAADGKLVSRSQPGAVLESPDDCLQQVGRLIGGLSGIPADTICVHGDHPAAVVFASQLNAFFTERKIALKPAGELAFSISRLGERSLLAQLPPRIAKSTHRRIRALQRALEGLKGITETIPCYAELKIDFDPLVISASALETYIENIELHAMDLPQPRLVEVPVCYDGPDLSRVADYTGLHVEEVAWLHSEGVFQVYMLGFSPGFAYLGGLSRKLATPRLDSPRISVPAGSVGIAGNQTGIYPVSSPGGWNLIGRTPLKLFDPSSESPFLFEAGDEVRFVPVSSEVFDALG